MKLLIIDDEKLTREGIANSIDWNLLEINEIIQADDGIHGWKLALVHRPEIILSDVRMPRMNGIDMAIKIRQFLKDCSIIFMSGYSDKEYLKAAIKLKAVNYVEKPIEIEEVQLAIQEAVDTQKKYIQTKENIYRRYHYAKSRLALQLLTPHSPSSVPNYNRELKTLGFDTNTNMTFTTLIIQFQFPISDISESEFNLFCRRIEDRLKDFQMKSLTAVKQDKYLILHLIPKSYCQDSTYQNLSKQIAEIAAEKYCIYLSVGSKVIGAEHVYESYRQAVILLQSAFFYPYNSVISKKAEAPLPNIQDNASDAFFEALVNKDKIEAYEIIKEIYQLLLYNQTLLPNQVIELYYSFCTVLKQAASLHRILVDETDSKYILDYITSNKNLDEINDFIIRRLKQFFLSVEESDSDSATIFAVKEYISKHYQNSFLSIKDISEYVCLSSTYLCTVFKAGTGITLNQFLTSYRMEKAKNMLLDNRYKITEISTKVGYRDGNYFGKSFKKIVGLSPSEYRERFL